MSEENLSGEIQNTPSHDEVAAPSTAPEALAQPEGQVEAGATETPEEAKKPNKVQERINQLTREKYEQRQENAELKARLDKLEQVKSEVKSEVRVAPNEDDFDTQQEYHSANAKYYADVASDAAQAKVTQHSQETTKAEKQEQRQKDLQVKKAAFDEKVESKKASFENFEEVAYGHPFMDLDMADTIFDLPNGVEVAYHLGNNQDIAEKIKALPEGSKERSHELYDLNSQVKALQPKLVSDAPDPINPLGNSETVQTDPDKMNADEWRDWRNKQVHG